MYVVTLHCPRLGLAEKVWEFTEDDGESVDHLLADWRELLTGGR